MAIAFDSANGNGGYPPSGFSFSHSLGDGSGNNRVVVVGVLLKGSDPVVTACTYNGTSMSFLGEQEESYYSAYMRLRLYVLLDTSLPSSSGSYTVSVTATDAYDGYAAAASYTGVSQTTPPYTLDGDWSNPPFDEDEYSTNRTVVASTGTVVDFGGIDPSSATAQSSATGQTERHDSGYNATDIVVSEKAFTSSGSLTMGHTPNGTNNSWLHGLIELAASGGSPPGPTGQISLLGSDSFSGYTTAPYANNYTCHSGTNRKLMVGVGTEGGGDINSVTYDGESLTALTQREEGSNDVRWFYLDDADFPSTPGSYSINVTFGYTPARGRAVFVLELGGAEQGAVDAENGSNFTSTDTINTTVTTLAAKSWILGCVSCGENETWTADSGQTLVAQEQVSSGGSSYVVGYEEIASASATNMQWVASDSCNRLVQSLVSIAPAPVEDVSNAVMIGTNF